MHVKFRLGGADSYPSWALHTLAVAPPGCDGHFLRGSAPDEFRFSRASSWTFFINVCSGLQQISHRSRLSSGISCLPSLAPFTLTRAHPRWLPDSRKQQSQTKVVFVPILEIRLAHGSAARETRAPDLKAKIAIPDSRKPAHAPGFPPLSSCWPIGDRQWAAL